MVRRRCRLRRRRRGVVAAAHGLHPVRGEWLIYFTLIALGGAVLLGLTSLVLVPIVQGGDRRVIAWVLPSGAAAGAVVAAWLVEAKKSIVENLAPVLTAIFTPLFAIMLVVSVVRVFVGGIGREFDREMLVGVRRAAARRRRAGRLRHLDAAVRS